MTPEAEGRLRDLWKTHSRADICKLLNMTESTLYRKAKSLGLGIKQERASLGGRVDTDASRDMRATRHFEQAYRAAAKRNRWIVWDFRA